MLILISQLFIKEKQEKLVKPRKFFLSMVYLSVCFYSLRCNNFKALCETRMNDHKKEKKVAFAITALEVMIHLQAFFSSQTSNNFLQFSNKGSVISV